MSSRDLQVAAELCGAAAVLSFLAAKYASLARHDFPEDHWTRGNLRIGHRGCRIPAAPTGNTMSAFGLGSNSDGLELDVQLTRDGHVVVFHDLYTGDHLQGDNLRVTSMTLGELQQRKFVADADRNEVVPTLTQVIQFAKKRGLKLIVELKGWDRYWDTARAVAAELQQYEYVGHTMMISFNPMHIYAFRSVAPTVPIALISTDDFFTDLLGLANIPILNRLMYLFDKSYELFALTPNLLPSFLGSSGISAHFSAWSAARARAALSQNYTTNAWTVNCPDEARSLKEAGVTMITTDLPHIPI